MGNLQTYKPVKRTGAVREGQMLHFRKSGKSKNCSKTAANLLSVSLNWVILRRTPEI